MYLRREEKKRANWSLRMLLRTFIFSLHIDICSPSIDHESPCVLCILSGSSFSPAAVATCLCKNSSNGRAQQQQQLKKYIAYKLGILNVRIIAFMSRDNLLHFFSSSCCFFVDSSRNSLLAEKASDRRCNSDDVHRLAGSFSLSSVSFSVCCSLREQKNVQQ